MTKWGISEAFENFDSKSLSNKRGHVKKVYEDEQMGNMWLL